MVGGGFGKHVLGLFGWLLFFYEELVLQVQFLPFLVDSFSSGTV